MISIVPEQHQQTLSTAIAKAEYETLKQIVEQNAIDVNSFMDDKHYEPILMGILVSRGFPNEDDRLMMLRYALDKGANPNTKSKSGYNCLHIAVQQEKLIRALDLFLDFDGDVNLTDGNGATVAYWVIQRFPWRTEGAEREMFLKVVEKTIMLGADLDYKNKFGVSPRSWLENTSDDVKLLVEKCEKLNPVYTPSHIIQPKFPTNLQHPEIAQKIWKELVPPSGQAQTVQGELLRAVEKLRDEAQRNGNINYAESHKLLAKFISDTLTSSELFDKKEFTKIKSETRKLMKADEPYTEDDIYDYLTDKVCVFYDQKPELLPHPNNPQIVC